MNEFLSRILDCSRLFAFRTDLSPIHRRTIPRLKANEWCWFAFAVLLHSQCFLSNYRHFNKGRGVYQLLLTTTTTTTTTTTATT